MSATQHPSPSADKYRIGLLQLYQYGARSSKPQKHCCLECAGHHWVSVRHDPGHTVLAQVHDMQRYCSSVFHMRSHDTHSQTKFISFDFSSFPSHTIGKVTASTYLWFQLLMGHLKVSRRCWNVPSPAATRPPQASSPPLILALPRQMATIRGRKEFGALEHVYKLYLKLVFM